MFTKMSPRRGAAALSVLSVLALSGSTLAGGLNPPAGNVAPTMKTLDQVEARIPIPGGVNPGQFTITQPGSYYMTGNRVYTQGNTPASIKITVDDVTIDLNGYAIIATGAGRLGDAISDRSDDGTSGIVNPVVRNGAIAGPGIDDSGLALGYSNGARVENMTVRNVMNGEAIYVGEGGMVVDCTASFSETGFSGAGATFLRCSAVRNSSNGFRLYRSSARECAATGNTGYGFLANTKSVVESCVARDNFPSGGVGIQIEGDGCRVDSNSVQGSFFGIALGSGATNAVVTRNAVLKGSGSAFAMNGQIVGNFPNNHVAQIIADPASQFTATNPWANLSY